MQIAMLSGGVGGARMVRGFAALDGISPVVIVNVADDERIHGLCVSPDLDTVVYTLAGVEGEEGWGRADETWRVTTELARFGVDTRFRLGDTDLATNLFRTERLADGVPLSEVTRSICDAFGVRTEILPATNDEVRTFLRRKGSDEWLDFQTYFVRRQHTDRIDRVRYEAIDAARPAPGVLDAIRAADAVVIGPSNPILSIRPILAVPGIREAVAAHPRVLVVSPLIGGDAVKGPAATLLADLGYRPGTKGVLEAYAGIVSDVVVDTEDADEEIERVRVWSTDIRIPDPESSRRLAQEIISWLQ